MYTTFTALMLSVLVIAPLGQPRAADNFTTVGVPTTPCQKLRKMSMKRVDLRNKGKKHLLVLRQIEHDCRRILTENFPLVDAHSKNQSACTVLSEQPNLSSEVSQFLTQLRIRERRTQLACKRLLRGRPSAGK